MTFLLCRNKQRGFRRLDAEHLYGNSPQLAVIGQPVGMFLFPERGDWSVGGLRSPDTLQRSGLLSVSAARHKGRTASRSCPDRLAFHPDASATCLAIAAEIRRQRYRGDSRASAGKLKLKAGARYRREAADQGESDGRSRADPRDFNTQRRRRISSPALISFRPLPSNIA